MTLRHTLVGAALLSAALSPLWGQTAPPSVNAGSLLEQQRRLSPPAEPQGLAPGVLPAAPLPTGPATGPTSSTHTTVRNFAIDGNTLIDPAAVQAVLAAWLNRPVGLADLRQATAAVEDLFRQSGWLARVRLPGQDITDGTVRFTVIESRLGRIVVQPGDEPLAADLTARVHALLAYHLPADQPLSLFALERALLLANDLPGVRVSGSLQASDSPGSTDLIVTLRPSERLRGEASLDNGGNRATGSERTTAQLSLLSPLGQGEHLNLAASFSRGSQFVSLAASVPLPGALGYQGWRMAAAASGLRYQVRDARNTSTGLAPEGGSTTLDVRLHYPLVRTAVAHWIASAGYVQTQLENRDDNLVLNQRETTSRARSRAWQFSLGGSQFDRWHGGGANSASIALTSGQLRLDGSPAQYIADDAASVATQGRFSKLRWNASRLQTLGPQTSLLAAATGQMASTNLDPSEKMYLGGMHGVRAYPNAEGGGSTGQQISLDVRQDLGPQWQASVLYDWGQVHQYKNNHYASNSTPLLQRGNRVALQGAGLGLAWRGARGVHIQATWARRIGSNPLATLSGADTDGSLHKDRFWLNASFAF